MKRKQMTYETFLEVKRQKSLGVSQRQTAINLGLSRGMLERWWHKEEAEFLSSRSHQPKSLEQYREYILSVLKVYPQIRATNMYFKLTEQFSERIKRIFGEDARIDSYIKGIKDNRYINTQCKQIYHLINYYSETQMMSAIEHCLRVNICNTTELAAYLIYKFGASKSKRCFSKEKLIFYSKRAQKIKEELDG